MEFLNIIVENDNVLEGDADTLFGPHDHQCDGCSFCNDEEVVFVDQKTNMFDLLVMLGSFPSKGQARKNWKKTEAKIPDGWSEFIVGKKRRRLFIWNPS